MRKAFFILSTCILLGIPLTGQCQKPSDTPIKSLEDVLGFEPSTGSASTRQGGAAKSNSLVIREKKSEFELYRPVFNEAVSFFSEQYRTARLGWIQAICLSPRDAEKSPAVLLLDEEVRFVQVPYDQPDDLTWEEWEGKYYMRTPLAGYLLGTGYSVIIPTLKTLQNYRRIHPKEWVNLINEFRSMESIDKNSFFLVSTREYAELAFKLAGETKFAGVTIEEPSHMIFRDVPKQPKQSPNEKRKGPPPFYIANHPPEGTPPKIEDVTPDVAGRYVGYMKRIKSPTLMIMARDSNYAEFNSKILLMALTKAGTDFRVIMLDKPARIHRSESDRQSTLTQIRRKEETQFEESAQTAGFSYDLRGMETWLARMLHFLGERSLTKPEPLPIPDPDLPRQQQVQSILRSMGVKSLGSEPFQDIPDDFDDSEDTGGG